MKTIELSKEQVALVDDCDYDFINQFTWYYHNEGYAARRGERNGKSVMFMMHREVLGTPWTAQVDHIDHNKLNNCRRNLRICTNAQNQANRRKVRGNTPYKGVHFVSKDNNYMAYIDHERKRINLGRFKNAEEGALAYDKAALRLKGEFALINFPRVDNE